MKKIYLPALIFLIGISSSLSAAECDILNRNIKMVEAAREVASELVDRGLDEELSKLVEEGEGLHME